MGQTYHSVCILATAGSGLISRLISRELEARVSGGAGARLRADAPSAEPALLAGASRRTATRVCPRPIARARSARATSRGTCGFAVAANP